ncbi:MAG: sphingosine kinase [Myxococcales bacterium]|nr:sphingosine kinase [Myxococcales bacterium]
MSGIGIVLNPRARRNVQDPDAPLRLAHQLGDDGLVKIARDRAELARVAEDFKRIGIEILCIAGGDGTNHVTLTGFFEVYGATPLPIVSLLRGGTMNTVANSLGIPRRSPEQLLHATRRAYARRSRLPLAFVEHNVVRAGANYGFIFGTGAIHGFISTYSDHPEPSPLWAAQVLARACAGAFTRGATLRRVAARWEGRVVFEDGASFPERDYLAIGASTVGQIGLGFKPFYRNGQLPDHFHMLGIHCSAGTFIRSLPRVWRGIGLQPKHNYERLVQRAVLMPRHGVTGYQLDGDVFDHPGELEVAIGPRVRILRPQR